MYWQYFYISVTLIYEQVWVTDPNHSDRRSTWPQLRKQHQRSAVRRQQLQQQLQSVARKQQLRRQLQRSARKQQLRRQLQRSARRQQLRRLLQRSARRQQLRRLQLSNLLLNKKPATLCGGFFIFLTKLFATYPRDLFLKNQKLSQKFRPVQLDHLSINDQQIASAHFLHDPAPP